MSIEDDWFRLPPEDIALIESILGVRYKEKQPDTLTDTPSQTRAQSQAPAAQEVSSSRKADIVEEAKSWLPDTSLFPLVAPILTSDSSDDQIQESLLEVLGFDGFDAISKLLARRKEISMALEQTQNPIMITAPKSAPRPASIGTETEVSGHPGYQESNLGTGIRVKVHQKQQSQKYQDPPPLDNNQVPITDADALRRHHAQRLLENQNRPLFSSDYGKMRSGQLNLPHVYVKPAHKEASSVSVFGTEYALPAGTERRNTGDFEEIILPMSEPSVAMPGERQVLITDIEDWCRPVFRGYQSLNRIQSIVYETAYFTNENMLISAPTGAGKTDIAMLTLLSVVRHFVKNANSNPPEHIKEDIKMVYVAPMKALATEVAMKFSKRLGCLGLTVKEWTGDTQLTATEIGETQLFVTTPEKWDVVTRKGTIDPGLVRLLLLDEVHLLHDERGAVIETLVARTMRMAERTQSMIRIVGLSATLPNYIDVAEFLGVNFQRGLFVFDNSYRPVPLGQTLIGVKGRGQQARDRMNTAMYEKISDVLKQDRQAMVFVHSRKDTVNTGFVILEKAGFEGEPELFEVDPELKQSAKWMSFQQEVTKSRNKELKSLFTHGIGIHHAGMLRSDRLLTERMFSAGVLKVLVCTATLAWGVNLPAYAVIIKGTQVYSSEKGAFVDLSILDVLQIFGRAGRPQFEPHGLAYLITSHDRLAHFAQRLSMKYPIESKFSDKLINNLNAEICSTGSISSVDEAIRWLGYTFWMVRARKNPEVYGLRDWDPQLDKNLVGARRDLVQAAAKVLHKSQMVLYDETSGILTPKDIGRVAAGYYIGQESIEVFNASLSPQCTEADVLGVISCCHEFDGIKVRDEEMKELKKLIENGYVPCQIKLGPEHVYGKINTLLQAYISRASLDDFALISDTGYIAQNVPRILRALFEIVLKRHWGSLAAVILSLCKSVERRMWSFEHPLGQFSIQPNIYVQLPSSKSKTPTLPFEALRKIQDADCDIPTLRDMEAKEIGQLIKNQKLAPQVRKCVSWFPQLDVDIRLMPLTRTVIRLEVAVTPDFEWNDRFHGGAESFWFWIEDDESNENYASEYFVLNKKQSNETSRLSFVFPVADPLPARLYLRVTSDRWIGAENYLQISFRQLVLPEMTSPHTDLLDLNPLPIKALRDELFEELYRPKFSHFNPIQTQVFHSLYHTDQNILIGAPTGSGKTVCAELCMFRAFSQSPDIKVVYIAPLKALVRERLLDWKTRLHNIGKTVVELTGDSTPDLDSLMRASVIISTPEKWDSVSRGWTRRSFVKKVSLVILDEIHLLGSERGPVLEVIVSRMNYIGFCTGQRIRLVGLSTALANAMDLALWLDVDPVTGLYNFRHSVRPVPLEIYIDGFPGKHYCPRMQSMNKPVYQSIQMHSPDKPVIVFVSSRRQTRLTAKDLITLCAMSSENHKRFLKVSEDEMDGVLQQVQDQTLRHTLSFGIGIHHAGLTPNDRQIVEHLFTNQNIQILIATSTIAWGLNTPAHLVVIKGTEFFDARQKKYVDMPITDILQMMGRAGRPGYDSSGKAHLMVEVGKKPFYKKFLHEPFPVESQLHQQDGRIMADHLNAEIASGMLKSRVDCMEYLTWTYFYRRLKQNPSFYDLIPLALQDEVEEKNENALPIYGYGHVSQDDLNMFLSKMIDQSLNKLQASGCVHVDESEDVLVPTPLGEVASTYYLSHLTIRHFRDRLQNQSKFDLLDLLRLVSEASEFAEVPVRHNEDIMNKQLNSNLRFPEPLNTDFLSPNIKSFLLLQSHLMRIHVEDLPCLDYLTDRKLVLDSSMRVAMSLIDLASELQMECDIVLGIVELVQCLKQGCWWDQSCLYAMGVIEKEDDWRLVSMRDVTDRPIGVADLLYGDFSKLSLPKGADTRRVTDVLKRLPKLTARVVSSGNQEVVLSLDEAATHGYNVDRTGWAIIIRRGSNVVGLKRVIITGSKKTVKIQLSEISTESTGMIYIMSLGYRGLDQIIQLP